jgi:crossover junction endodeoxyribonuclease RuvC
MGGGTEAGSGGLRVLGVDPGLADTGYAALRGGGAVPAVLGTGLIRTAPGEPLEARLERLYDGAREVLARFQPDLLVIEDVFSAAAVPRAAILMGHARSVICLAARQAHVAVQAVAPAEVKRAVTASGVAPKAQVARAVQALLRLPRPPRPSHVADALALALTGLSRARGLSGVDRRVLAGPR